MKKVFKNVSELVGNTPLLELTKIQRLYQLKSKIFAKLEYFNPTGSVKDRAAKKMLDDAFEKGLINKDTTIIEPTSGNTGIGLASMGISRGLKVIIVMPNNMSIERIQLIKAYGADVILTDGSKGMNGAIEKAFELKKEITNSYIPMQFDNVSNVYAHFENTGKEIYNDLEGNVDIFVSCVGTGGTLTGTGKFLKEMNKDIQVVAVEPKGSPVLSEGKSGEHQIQGIGAGFVPKILDTQIYDEIVTVTDEDAYYYCNLVSKTEGILVGISSGAALAAAIELAKRKDYNNKNIVVIFPDTGFRYLSTNVFEK